MRGRASPEEWEGKSRRRRRTDRQEAKEVKREVHWVREGLDWQPLGPSPGEEPPVSPLRDNHCCLAVGAIPAQKVLGIH